MSQLMHVEITFGNWYLNAKRPSRLYIGFSIDKSLNLIKIFSHYRDQRKLERHVIYLFTRLIEISIAVTYNLSTALFVKVSALCWRWA